MPTLEEVRTWRGVDVYGQGDDKIGEIADIYLDRQSGEPEWLAVLTGLLGSKVSFVPIADAVRTEQAVVVPFTKDMVKDAPNVDADGELAPEEERRLYDHYGVTWGEFADEEPERPAGDHSLGPETDTAMTRSEEEMVVGTRQEETGRARLRKYIVTEDVQRTVPISTEEVRVEREPITGELRKEQIEVDAPRR